MGHSDKRFPGYDIETKELDADTLRRYIFGGHVAEYMETLADDDEERYKSQFSGYIEDEIEADVWRSFTARLTARSVRTHGRRTRRPAPRRARRSGRPRARSTALPRRPRSRRGPPSSRRSRSLPARSKLSSTVPLAWLDVGHRRRGSAYGCGCLACSCTSNASSATQNLRYPF